MGGNFLLCGFEVGDDVVEVCNVGVHALFGVETAVVIVCLIEGLRGTLDVSAKVAKARVGVGAQVYYGFFKGEVGVSSFFSRCGDLLDTGAAVHGFAVVELEGDAVILGESEVAYFFASAV